MRKDYIMKGGFAISQNAAVRACLLDYYSQVICLLSCVCVKGVHLR